MFNETMKRTSLILIFIFMPVLGYCDWEYYEETIINSNISGLVKNGHIFKTQSGNLYRSHILKISIS